MFISILTPSYNRVHTLKKLYDSLENQSNKGFEWIIVDDGSTDDTRSYIMEVINKASFTVRYIYINNGGKHSAINEGVKVIGNALTFIVDSDDYLTRDAVDVIFKIWQEYKSNSSIASFWFLQSDPNGNLVGEKFPIDNSISTYTDIMINSGIKGDKKSVYVTEVRKKFPFPIFLEEKFIGESTVHKRIGDKYNSVFVNKVIYISEYLSDGLTSAGTNMRIKNPLGGMTNSKEFLSNNVIFKIRIKKLILFIMYGFFAKKDYKKIILNSGSPILAIICTPVSYLLFKKWGKLK